MDVDVDDNDDERWQQRETRAATVREKEKEKGGNLMSRVDGQGNECLFRARSGQDACFNVRVPELDWLTGWLQEINVPVDPRCPIAAT